MNQNLPSHIVVIPDGNRRWAKERNLAPWHGHQEALKRFEEIFKEAVNLGIPYFSFWALSLDNIKKRSKREVGFLLKILEKELKKFVSQKDVHQKKIKINILGFWQDWVPQRLKQAIKEAISRTKDYDRFFLNLFLAYNGWEEMLKAIKEIARKVKKNPGLKINFDLIKKHLFTKNLPPVDYLIRTGGEPHLSTGFMMWDIADSQLYFTDTYFPDFDKKEFKKALLEYQRRGRRFGG